MNAGGGRLRLGVVLDAALEGWTSMEYVGEMLIENLRREHSTNVEAIPIQPRVPRILGRLPTPARWFGTNADRFVARCIVYPTVMARLRRHFDAFHIVDHSYAHAAHALPPARTGIYCHDLDALAPLLDARGLHPPWRHILARSVLRALERAAVVFYSTRQIREAIIRKGLLSDDKLVHAPYGVAPEFRLAGEMPPEFAHWRPTAPFLLHVGSGVPRKRLELLFHTFARVRAAHPGLLLVQQGASLTRTQKQLVQQLGLSSALIQPPPLPRAALAELYRHAALVVLPSRREGFGLPVVEALACGALVLASDIPPFREVGGDAVTYCDDDLPGPWSDAMLMLLGSQKVPTQASRLAQAAKFTWAGHARVIAEAYLALG